jgi:hypothetical protein
MYDVRHVFPNTNKLYFFKVQTFNDDSFVGSIVGSIVGSFVDSIVGSIVDSIQICNI